MTVVFLKSLEKTYLGSTTRTHIETSIAIFEIIIVNLNNFTLYTNDTSKITSETKNEQLVHRLITSLKQLEDWFTKTI